MFTVVKLPLQLTSPASLLIGWFLIFDEVHAAFALNLQQSVLDVLIKRVLA